MGETVETLAIVIMTMMIKNSVLHVTAPAFVHGAAVRALPKTTTQTNVHYAREPVNVLIAMEKVIVTNDNHRIAYS